jgi:hypothetical protein
MASSEERVEELFCDDSLVNKARLYSISQRDGSLAQGGDAFL